MNRIFYSNKKTILKKILLINRLKKILLINRLKRVVHLNKMKQEIQKKNFFETNKSLYLASSNKEDNIDYDDLSYVLNEIEKKGNTKFIIVLGGIGDFITMDNILSLSSKFNVIFISKQSICLKKLLDYYQPEFSHYAVYFNFSVINKPGFNSETEFLTYFDPLKNIAIYDIGDIFNIIKNISKNTPNTILNSFIFNKNDENIVNKYNLPKNYAIIVPYTEDNRIDCNNCNRQHTEITECKLTRNFIHEDYENIFNFLEKKNIIGVVISSKELSIINSFANRMINLSGKTSLIDSFEIAKKSSYYLGIDSFLSIICAKILDADKIYIKCNNKHGINNKNIYFYPKYDLKLYDIISFTE